jgi:hypothetical protein
MIELFFGALLALLANSQYSFEDCKAEKFKGKQCKVQKAMFDLGNKSKK